MSDNTGNKMPTYDGTMPKVLAAMLIVAGAGVVYYGTQRVASPPVFAKKVLSAERAGDDIVLQVEGNTDVFNVERGDAALHQRAQQIMQCLEDGHTVTADIRGHSRRYSNLLNLGQCTVDEFNYRCGKGHRD